MSFAKSKHFKIERSAFNNIARDQNTTYLFNVAGDVAVQGPSQQADGLRSRPPTRLPARRLPPLPVSWTDITSISPFNTAKALIITIYLVIHEIGDHSQDWSDFLASLDLLTRTLRLLDMVVAILERMPSGQATVEAIVLKVEECAQKLSCLLGDIYRYRDELKCTRIGQLWYMVLWAAGYACKDVLALQSELAGIGVPLARVLVAFSSDIWKRLVSGSPSSAGFSDFFLELHEHIRLCSLQEVKLVTFSIIDHLGRNIPIPLEVCTSFKDLQLVVNIYCKERIGSRYIEEGDYCFVRASDAAIIPKADILNYILPDEVFEISIILQLDNSWGTNKKKCPRCKHINAHTIEFDPGWIECVRCSGKFQAGMDVDVRQSWLVDSGPELEPDEGVNLNMQIRTMLVRKLHCFVAYLRFWRRLQFLRMVTGTLSLLRRQLALKKP